MKVVTIAKLFDLAGKGAIVTGGALGIGRAICLRLAEAGAGVIVSDIDLKAANETVKEIKSRGGKARAIRADAANIADAKVVVQATMKEFGSVDLLVNNAAIYPPMPALQMTEEVWEKVLNINLKGCFFYSQAAIHEMIKSRRGGKIINIASYSAFYASGGMAHYEASKAGVVMLTKSLAKEFGSQNIMVNVVLPGNIRTPGTTRPTAGLLEVAHSKGLSGETDEEIMNKLMEGMGAQAPLGRLGEPDDIARVVLCLASAASDYMTGSVVAVDGGWLLL